MGDEKPANRTKTGRFGKGQSGNPRGRPKNTPEQTDALHKLRSLAPAAVDEARRILDDPQESAAVKLRVVELILDRTYGKATQSLDIAGVQPVIIDSIPRVAYDAEGGGGT